MIITSLLDTDLYKFTMMQVVLHHFSAAEVEYRFNCRTPNINFDACIAEINKEIDAWCNLQLNTDELDYLRSLPFFKSDFIDFLALYKPNRKYIEIKNENGFELIIRGPWLQTILFEVPLLAIINEVYFKVNFPDISEAEGGLNLNNKITQVQNSLLINKLKFTDFGTRRRYSKHWQEHLIKTLQAKLPHNFIGTSNLYFAKKYKLKAIGTMAHEYIQACQVLGPNIRDSQKYAFDVWAHEYNGELGIALSDTYTIDVFIRDFDLYFCKLYDGIRQDSGDPFAWTEKILQHYESLGIDSKSKTLVYSDSLTMTKALAILERYQDKAQIVFGIGTHLTNDMGPKPIQIVIKMTACNGRPVAKITDDPEKQIHQDEQYFQYLKYIFDVK